MAKSEFSNKLRKVVDAIVSASPDEITERLNELQSVLDGDFSSAVDRDAQGDVRDFLESSQIFMNVFAAKAQELRHSNRLEEAKVLERFMARYTKMLNEEGFAGWTDSLYRRDE
jgi:hypothetical protein